MSSTRETLIKYLTSCIYKARPKEKEYFSTDKNKLTIFDNKTYGEFFSVKKFSSLSNFPENKVKLFT